MSERSLPSDQGNCLTTDHTLVALTHDVLSISQWRKAIEHPDVGAHAWFEGVTRRMTGAQETIRLEYDAYGAMAYSELANLAVQIVDRHELYRLIIVHRLGIVPIGEASLLVGCSAPHRANVLRAMGEVIDRIKCDVPIWKREHFADGSRSWVHPS